MYFIFVGKTKKYRNVWSITNSSITQLVYFFINNYLVASTVF